MTMTEARPTEGSATPDSDGPPPAPPTPIGDAILDSADHKRIGLVFLGVSLLTLLAVRALGVALGADLVKASIHIVGDDSKRIYALYESGLVLLFLSPFWVGLSTYVLPLQIGTSRLAFPRLQALALWTTIGGAGLFVVGHLVDPPPGIGLSDNTPLIAPIGGINRGTNLILVGIILLVVASILAAGNLLTTALTLRPDGMTLTRMPLFAWSVVATSAGILLASPIFLAGAFLLYLDLHYGGTALFGAGKAAGLVWQKSLWLYGRPEIFLLGLPGLGAASDIVVTAAKRPIADPPTPPVPASLRRRMPPMPGITSPLKGHMLAVGALCAVVAVSLLTWAQDVPTLHSVVLPTASLGTALIVIPVGQLVLLWLGTLGTARAKPTLALGYVVAALLVWGAAAANAIIARFAHVHSVAGSSAFASGQIELVSIGAPTILAFGALYHWSGKLFGNRMSAAAGALALLSSLGGTLALGIGQSIAGYAGAAAHLKEAVSGDAQTGFVIAEIGHVLLLVAGVVVVLDIVRAMATGRRSDPRPADLTEGITLEWATSSPPPLANFDQVPDVRSEAPVLDLLKAEEGSKK